MKILLTTGGSDYSFMAINKACEMVIDPDSTEIRIISVYDDFAEMAAEPLEISAELIQELENIGRLQSTENSLRAQEIIKKHFPDQNINISMKAIKGYAKNKILEEAEKWGADLIVVGSVGHNFLSRFFLGSVSEAIVHHAKCSVLVIREEVEQ